MNFKFYIILTVLCVSCVYKMPNESDASKVRILDHADIDMADADLSVFSYNFEMRSVKDLPKVPGNVKVVDAPMVLPNKPVKKYPQFVGGERALYLWLRSNQIFPTELLDKIEGAFVMACLHVNNEGAVDSIFNVINGPDEISKATISLMSRIPNWEPAIDEDGQSTDYWTYVGYYFLSPKQQSKEVAIVQQHTDAGLHNSAPISIEPKFPDGEDKMNEWLKNQMSNEPQLPCHSRRVSMEFKIDKQGVIHDVKVARPWPDGLDEIGLRLVEKMPRWIPAMDKFGLEECTMSLPIRFNEELNRDKCKK